jgi:hypothetical protein
VRIIRNIKNADLLPVKVGEAFTTKLQSVKNVKGKEHGVCMGVCVCMHVCGPCVMASSSPHITTFSIRHIGIDDCRKLKILL